MKTTREERQTIRECLPGNTLMVRLADDGDLCEAALDEVGDVLQMNRQLDELCETYERQTSECQRALAEAQLKDVNRVTTITQADRMIEQLVEVSSQLREQIEHLQRALADERRRNSPFKLNPIGYAQQDRQGRLT